MSKLSLDALRLLLLDLLSDARSVAPDTVAALDDAQWETMLVMVRQHRLAPLLHWQLTRRHDRLAIPAAIAIELKQAFVASRHRQLGIQFELCAARRLLDGAGIASIALKGGFLAFMAYPDPALRPLRDLDILVTEDRLIEAYRLMRANGAMPGSDGDDAAALDYAIAADEHHLPILIAPSALARIELHKHIQSVSSVADSARDGDLLDGIWRNAVRLTIAEVGLDFPAPTDMLLHVVMHAAYNHLLNNGPLTLADIAFLLRAHAVDWERFWRDADRVGATRGAVLLLDLAAHYWGPLPIEWSDDAAALRADIAEVRDPAALLMLQDRTITPEIWRKRGREDSGWRARAARALHLIFLPRLEMAMIYPVRAESPRVLLYYPLRWWALATRRLPDVVTTRQRPDLQEQTAIDTRVSRWLGA